MSQPEKAHTPLPVARLPGNGQLASPPTPVPLPAGLLPLFGAESKPAGPPALTAPPNSRALWRAFRRCWLLAVVLAVIGAAVGVGGVMLVMPAPYKAEAWIEVTPPSGDRDLGEN